MTELEDLYERYGEKLHAYLVFRLGPGQDAEDVLQDVFCRLARRVLGMRLVRDPRAFVFRVARNEANRFLRRKIGRRAGEQEMSSRLDILTGSLRAAVAEPAPSGEGLEVLLSAADALPQEQKEAVFLKVFEGLTFREIGAACGIPADTAASRCRYGLEKLRKALEERK